MILCLVNLRQSGYKEVITQGERWRLNFEEEKGFLKVNHRNLSKYYHEERRFYTCLKHNRKVLNAEAISLERKEPFEQLMAECEYLRKVNQ